jgi:nitrous oxidase accessory protein NosD
MSDPPNSSQSSTLYGTNWHIKLRQLLVDYFDESELETLCFDLRVDYESLGGDGKAKKAIELIELFVRLGRIVELIDYCSQLRPNIPWSDLREAAIGNPLIVADAPDRGLSGSIPDHQQTKRASSGRSLAIPYAVGIGAAVVVMVVIGGLFVVKPPFNRVIPSPTSTATSTATKQLPATASLTATEAPPTDAPVIPTAIAISPVSLVVCPSGCPFDQIGPAIEMAQPGETITIGPGTYTENLSIGKSLKLSGAGAAQTRIEAKEPGPVLIIKSNTEIHVDLDGLSVAGGDVRGGAAGCIPQPEDCRNGVVVRGQAQATLTGITLDNNPDTGLWVRDTAQVTLADSHILNNGTAGLAVADSAKVTVQNSVISENKGRSVISAGIRVEGQSQLTLVSATLSGNAYSGLWVRESATVEVKDSIIKGSVGGFDYGSGIAVDGTATVTLLGSTVEGNGTDTQCLAAEFMSQVCNGVMVSGQAQLTIIDSIIRGNTDWGVTAVLSQCGYDKNQFIGQVRLIGDNEIQGNNRSGNHAGMGNPEGQVCLP